MDGFVFVDREHSHLSPHGHSCAGLLARSSITSEGQIAELMVVLLKLWYRRLMMKVSCGTVRKLTLICELRSQV